MGKCQSQESTRDYGVPKEVAEAVQPPTETSAAVEEPAAVLNAQVPAETSATVEEPVEESVVVNTPCITKQTLLEMPENAIELDENEQINIFSKLLVKNLIKLESTAVKPVAQPVAEPVAQPVAEPAVAEPVAEPAAESPAESAEPAAQQDEREEDEELEVKTQAETVIKQVIQEGCQKITAEKDEREEDMEISSQAVAVVTQVIQEGRQKIAGQTNVPFVIEAQVPDAAAVVTDENVEVHHLGEGEAQSLVIADEKIGVPPAGEGEAQASDAALVIADEKVEVNLPADNNLTDATNMTEVKVNSDPCPKCKGTGKTNLMGGARGLSFMKRQCKHCSSGTAAQAAKAGA
jgi:hypothetical protein